MLVKPIVTKLKQQDYFFDVRASKYAPTLDDLKNGPVVLPICYLLPVKDNGGQRSADNRPRQPITSTYSFCVIANSGDIDTIDEPPMTEAKLKLIEALLGFSISQDYEPMSFVSAQLQEVNKEYESWAIGFEARRTFKKQVS